MNRKNDGRRTLSRRLVLKGIGGIALALPILESLRPRAARAADPVVSPFAIFFRQANGVACQLETELGMEPERFWPTTLGPLTLDTVKGRALAELGAHLQRLLVVRNVNMSDYNFGDGHARGALQGMTARGPVVAGVAGDSEANGESIDHRIGRELNPDGRDSLFLYAGSSGGWLGGPCISYRGAGQRRTAQHNPKSAYNLIVGGDTSLSPEAWAELVGRQKSVNDLVRGQLQSLLARPELSTSDRQRVDQHLTAVRDIELKLGCKLGENKELELAGADSFYNSSDGFNVVSTVKLHMDIAALAVACGYTRSVAIQVGSGNDGSNRYPDFETGQLMADNFHYISHRRKSHDASGAIIAGSDWLHHKVDVQFARMFDYLLTQLAKYVMPDGKALIDHGVSVWYNDNGSGPPHARKNCPYVIGGGANGFLKQGQYVAADGDINHSKMLNTLGTAAGLRTAAGAFLDDFGDPALPKGVMTELLT
jgi:hypothetical protein